MRRLAPDTDALQTKSSPNVHAFVCRPNHRRTIRHVERLLKFGHIRERSVHAKLRGRMRIGGEPQLLIFIANLRSPDRGERQKETLLRRSEERRVGKEWRVRWGA